MTSSDSPRHWWSQYHGLLRIIPYVRKELLVFLVVFLTYGIFALANVGFAEIIQKVEEAFNNADSPWRLYAPVAMVILTIIRGVSYGLGQYLASYIGAGISYKLTIKMYQHIIRLPQSFFDRSSIGEIMSKITYNVGCMVRAIQNGIIVVLREGIAFVILLCYLFYLNWSLTLIITLVMPLIMILLRIARIRLGVLSKRLQKNAGRISRSMLEALSALVLVRSSAAEAQEIERFDKHISYGKKQNLKVAIVNAITLPSLQLIISLAFAIIVWIALSGQNSGFDSIGQFLAYLTAAGFIAKPLGSLSGVQAALQAGEVAARDYIRHLELKHEEDTGSTNIKRQEIKGELVFKNLYFSYGDGKEVFNNLNLRIKAQEKVALVGKSGAGKSTLINIILRLYLPQSGHIYLDGIDLVDIKLSSLRSSIAYVSQDIFLFNETVRYNLSYGLQEEISDEKLKQTLQRAQAWDFIESMPQGLDTFLGDRGVALSGGEKQRISLARAFLRNVPILILDEATSSLDTESEYRIQQVLNTLIARKTVLVVAHRLSTVERMDRILVLNKGMIEEEGTHRQLLSKGKRYAQLYKKQFTD